MEIVAVYGSWKLTGLKCFSGISEAGGDFEEGADQEDSQ